MPHRGPKAYCSSALAPPVSLKPRYCERELPGPSLTNLRFDLDRYARTSDAGTEHLTHPIDHGLLEQSDNLLGILAFG